MFWMNEVDSTAKNYSLSLSSSKSVTNSELNLDFRELLGKMYAKTNKFVIDFASPDEKGITIEGLGTFEDKTSAGAQFAASYYLQRMQNQFNLSMNNLEFLYNKLTAMVNQLMT